MICWVNLTGTIIFVKKTFKNNTKLLIWGIKGYGRLEKMINILARKKRKNPCRMFQTGVKMRLPNHPSRMQVFTSKSDMGERQWLFPTCK